MTRKKFFKRATEAEIMKYDSIRPISDNLVDEILEAGDNEALVIQSRLVPTKYAPVANLDVKLETIVRDGITGQHQKNILGGRSIRKILADTSKSFLTKGTEVKLRRIKSQKAAEKEPNTTPYDLRRTAFNAVKVVERPGYSIIPFTGPDKTITRIPLFECVEGAFIYGYTHLPIDPEARAQTGSPIEITSTLDGAAGRDGAAIILDIPSRNEKKSPYRIKVSHVPVVDNKNKLGISFRLKTDYVTDGKHKKHGWKQHMIRFKTRNPVEGADFNYITAYDAAAAYTILDHYVEKGNPIPFEMNQVVIPSQKMVDFYAKISNNCLIQTPGEEAPRKLHAGEKEVLLWQLVNQFGHDKTCQPEDGLKFKEYNWHNKK